MSQYISKQKRNRTIVKGNGLDMAEDTALGPLSRRESDSSEEEFTLTALPKLPTNQIGHAHYLGRKCLILICSHTAFF